MNIPLNIDWQQILLHLFNFAILAFGLYFLLYKPVKKFMDERVKYFDDMNKEAENKLNESEKIKSEYEAKLSEAQSEIDSKKAEAIKKANEQVALQLENAKAQAKEIVENAKAQAEQEKKNTLEQARKDIADIAKEAIGKLLTENDGSIDSFIEATKESGNK